ncbi:helix-turn-helix transcriptional regulator [Panacibacter sp. DH6]|uniref:Helix-turn-helix transcriptional regulator n=1 Tax=Panacibacter microcysteis TaxID=2793269 RepID=A0A931GWL5_9BACT|nr:AraC family transcriptional regulator [Panacibacter microcysteis]MBG9377815.1 helix-turn-helix transcriptional regulator [Panacibacter microcysteis]
MQQLAGGQFFGETTKTLLLNGLTVTDTVYTHDKVDWHYHEHAYFTFILQGCVKEINKTETLTCTPGSLLFHNWQEPHYNLKAPVYTRGFHIEIEDRWMKQFLENTTLEGNRCISDPSVKLLFHKMFCESAMSDKESAIGIESLLLQAFSHLYLTSNNTGAHKPKWVNVIREILHDGYNDNISLTTLAGETGIHPAHLCRDFSKYFGCNISAYIRMLKVQRSFALLPLKKYSLANISYECGFADQSHFIKCFKMYTGLRPLAYRKLLH